MIFWVVTGYDDVSDVGIRTHGFAADIMTASRIALDVRRERENNDYLRRKHSNRKPRTITVASLREVRDSIDVYILQVPVGVRLTE